MTSQDVNPGPVTDEQRIGQHLEAIKEQVSNLHGLLRDERVLQLSVRKNDFGEMMVCVPDPNDPNGVICR